MAEKITWCTECGEGVAANGNCPDEKCISHFTECPHSQHPEGCTKCQPVSAPSPGVGLPINAPRLVYWGHVEQRLIPKENFCEELCDVVLELHPIGVGAELAALRARLTALTTGALPKKSTTTTKES